jgi:hypothetical protein
MNLCEVCMTTDESSLCSPPISFPRALLLGATLASLACEQPPPPLGPDDEIASEDDDTEIGDESDSGESDDSGEDTGELDEDTTATDTAEDGEDDSLYPLVDGARWSYVVKNTFGQITETKVIDAHETVWQGMPAWKLVEMPNLAGEWDESVIVRDGDLTLRVHREELSSFGTNEILDYEPGFARANDAWVTVGFKEELTYDRIAYDGNGQNPIIEARAHTYEVLAVDEPITVPAGTFNCVKVERVRTLGAEAGALVWFWFAPGVGKVREERPIEMEIEELHSVTIPGGATYP